ncbi:histidine-containing phosphotransfer protein 1-like [Aristolochia californica]|uniref:histidine-containing phosphotransfer protein 1-like n=1 Tax=Aristolochia californica TaxID=171875 RepID=UPI0035D706C8
MDSSALKKQRYELVNSMLEEGFLDENFSQLEELGDETNPSFLGELISLFIEDAQRILSELTKTLGEADVDFKNADALVHQVKGTSSSVGGQKIVQACIECRQFCENKDLEGCMKGLQAMTAEFDTLKNKFESLIEVEKNILAHDFK